MVADTQRSPAGKKGQDFTQRCSMKDLPFPITSMRENVSKRTSLSSRAGRNHHRELLHDRMANAGRGNGLVVSVERTMGIAFWSSDLCKAEGGKICNPEIAESAAP